MARILALRCDACGRSFGGEQTRRRHQYVAGDRYRCYPDEELVARGFWRDRAAVWHRGPNPGQGMLPGVSEDVRPTPARVLARASDSLTSHAAARAVAFRTGSQKARLLLAYNDAGEEGLTTHEAAARTGIPHQSVTKRTADLIADGFLERTGIRPGPFGVDVSVCRVREAVTA